MKNQKESEGCFYQKIRDADPETNELVWGPFCLRSDQPIRCEIAAKNCDMTDEALNG